MLDNLDNIIAIDMLETLAKYGFTKLEDLPSILKSNPIFYKDFPGASKWMEDYYRKMKGCIEAEFIE